MMPRKKASGPAHSDSIVNVQEYCDTILSSLIDGVVVADRGFRITTFSARAERMTGIMAKSVQGKTLTDVFEPASVVPTLARKTLETGRSYSDSKFSMAGYFGKSRDMGLATSPLIDPKGNTLGVVIVFRDLSQINDLEERVRKGERLASLGVLSAGMAHEIKNPLGGIRGATQLLRDELGQGHSLCEYTDIIIREVDRVNKIVLGLLDFSRPIELKLRSVNLHQLLDRVLSLVQMEDQGKDVRYVRNYDPSLPEITADPDQMTQVYLNLLKNGMDAMGRRGKLSLTTRMLSGYRLQDGTAGKRGMVAVEIEDNGCGIEAEEIAKVFDPFYTRKAKGVGLGLALCHRIVEEHGGKIDVTSTPEKGTLFRVSLPITIPNKKG